MILIGLGANLPSRHGGPRETLEAALAALDRDGIRVVRRSPWYRSAPVPASDQPWFVNGVAQLESDLPPDALLARLHAVEAAFGRARSVPNAARAIDLDLLDHDGRIAQAGPILPHPRLHERAFVLLPLRDLAPDWRHPVTGAGIEAMLRAVDPGQTTILLDPPG